MTPSADDGSNGDLHQHRWPTTSTFVPDADQIQQLNELRERGVELEESERQPSSQPEPPARDQEPGSGTLDVAGFKMLQSMLTSSLFSDYLHYRAIRCHDLPQLEMRVNRYCMDHKYLSWFCTMLDMLTRLLVWTAVFVALVSIVGATVYRAFLSEIFPIS